jgi:hypothetical protein
MTEKQFINTPLILSAYRNVPDWQERIKNDLATLVSFLNDHGLLRSGALSSADERAGLFILYERDLTEEGVQLFSYPIAAFDKWLGANSNPTKPLSMRSLENSLKKVRAGKK